jgi:hypothetical protein
VLIEAAPAPVVVEAAPPREAVVAEAHAVEAAPAVAPAEPKIDTRELLSDAGLVMIETKASAAAAVAPEVEDSAKLGRPRRERPREEEAELVQVETTRK